MGFWCVFAALLWIIPQVNLVHSQTQNKVQWLAACGHVSASSQSLRFILSLRLYSSFITSGPELAFGCWQSLSAKYLKQANIWCSLSLLYIPNCFFLSTLKFAWIVVINSLLTSVVCWLPLQTIWTQLRPDKTSGMIWIQTAWHSTDIPERTF